MASSSDEQPKPPEPPAAATALPQTHAEWAASLQAYYAAAGHPYAWPAQVKSRFALSARRRQVLFRLCFFTSLSLSPRMQHLMAAATYGAPVPFPVYHPGAAAAYYAHASMAAVSVPLLLQRSPVAELGSDLSGFGAEFAATVQGVPYPTAEAAAAAAAAAGPEGKGKGKGASPEKGSSGAPSGEDASRRYHQLFAVAVPI
jgi:plant G-box-binding factor